MLLWKALQWCGHDSCVREIRVIPIFTNGYEKRSSSSSSSSSDSSWPRTLAFQPWSRYSQKKNMKSVGKSQSNPSQFGHTTRLANLDNTSGSIFFFAAFGGFLCDNGVSPVTHPSRQRNKLGTHKMSVAYIMLFTFGKLTNLHGQDEYTRAFKIVCEHGPPPNLTLTLILTLTLVLTLTTYRNTKIPFLISQLALQLFHFCGKTYDLRQGCDKTRFLNFALSVVRQQNT
jgi:hypothetical protein